MDRGEITRQSFDIARIKQESDDYAISKTQRIYLSLRVIVTLIVIATLWLARLEYTIDSMKEHAKNDRGAIEMLWEKVFGYKMSP